MKITDAARKAARDAALSRWGTGSADTTQMLLSVDAALVAALPHLTDDGAAATPVADTVRVADVLHREKHSEACPFTNRVNCAEWAASVREAAALRAAGVFGEGATPAINREALTAAVMAKAQAVELEGGYIAVLIAPEDAVTAILPLIEGAS